MWVAFVYLVLSLAVGPESVPDAWIGFWDSISYGRKPWWGGKSLVLSQHYMSGFVDFQWMPHPFWGVGEGRKEVVVEGMGEEQGGEGDCAFYVKEIKII